MRRLGTFVINRYELKNHNPLLLYFCKEVQGMKTIEFYWNDLTEKKQKELLEIFGENCNWDVIPFATIDYEEEE